ncbi:MAG TPA: acetylxylan esterase [Anaerolineales bacterium]|nr:acetylxylan esterase [Anaerolineales bacterium]
MTKETRFSEQRLHVFRDEFFDAQFMRALTHQAFGGAELGECFWAAGQIKDGDFGSWMNVWQELAGRVETQAEKSLANGHPVSAREAYFRASNYYRCAELLISPGGALHHEMWEKSRQCFRIAGSLFDPPIEPIDIPFQDYRLPGYFIPACAEGEKRPTVIVIGGGDSSVEELYFYMGEGARRRGSHALLIEGPGQRGALHTNPGLVFRHDYEIPMKSVVEYALNRPEVDEDKLALYGLSLGGYLALRTVAFEKRIKACIANLFEFFVTGAEHDMVAPQYGQRTLSAYFRQLAYAGGLNSKAVIPTDPGA